MAKKVMLVNGSPHERGCTNRALDEVARALEANGIETSRFWISTKPIAGCIACSHCAKHNGQCVFNDIVNQFNEIASDFDAFVFGSPVYYAGMAGQLKCFMDRSFYSQALGGLGIYKGKPAACVASARRAGTTTALEQMEKFFSILEMPIVTSSYWNMVHGTSAEDVEKDEEGLRTMRVLGNNMARMLKLEEAGEAAGVPAAPVEPPARTNFIR